MTTTAVNHSANFLTAIDFFNASIRLDRTHFEHLLSSTITATYDRTEDGVHEKIYLEEKEQIVNRYATGLFNAALQVYPKAVKFYLPTNPETRLEIENQVAFQCATTIAYKTGTGANFQEKTTLSFDAEGRISRISSIVTRTNLFKLPT